MSNIDPLSHLERYGIGNLDATTLRHLHAIAEREVTALDVIREEIVEQNGEQAAKDEWDTVFAGDVLRYREAISQIGKAMHDRGLTL